MPSVKRKYKNFILFSCVSVIIYGVFVLFYGWGLKKDIFDPAVTGHLPIAIDSASCFILLGGALLFTVSEKPGNARSLSRVLAIGVFIWSIMFLIRDFTTIPIALIFGMSPQTAFCFMCLSVAFFFIKVKRRRYLIQGALHLVTLIASVAIIGHGLNIPEFYKMSFIPMAIYTAIGFVMLSIAASLINCDVGITALFTGNLIGNVMARKLFVKMLAAILIMGFLRISAHRQQWISAEMGSAILIVMFIIITLLLIWQTSARLNAIHIKRKIAEENFRVAVEAAPYAIVISDRGGIIITVNDHTRQLYGYKKGELIGNSVKTLIPEKLHMHYDRSRKDFFSSPSVSKLGFNDPISAKRKDGSEFPVEIILTPVKTSMDTFVLSTIVDITHRKHQEDTIKKQLIELQVKNEELEQFNYISSHDLQEPLRTVSNYIQMLEEDHSEHMNEDMREHLHAMASAVDRMSQVVRSLLDFGKLGRKRKLSLTDCNTVVQNAITDLGNLIKCTDANIMVVNELPVLYAYETELRQLFQNLVNNAIKFRDEGTRPEVRIGCHKSDAYFEFFVSDNGIGIDPKHLEKIFHIFHRLNNETEYEGHGIGLANCKKIAEMHGGNIWVESERGKGSTFKFTIFILKNG